MKDFFTSGAIISQNRDKLLVGWGERTWMEAPDSGVPSFYFPDFFLKDKKPWFTHAHFETISVDDFIKKISKEKNVERLTCQKPDKAFYEARFKELQKLFDEKILEKAVPFMYEESKTSMNETLFYHALKNGLSFLKTHDVYFYGFWENGEGMLGATPELLFRVNAKKLSTMALGGTFGTEEKLENEHQVIVKGIHESLRHLGEVKTGKMYPIKFAHYTHLRTDIEVELKADADWKVIVASLHPTPALGAFPRDSGWKWLHGYQQLIDRRRFGAPVGYFWKGEAVCYVAIRNFQWTPERILVAAGGGVVPESDMEEEWDEIQAKLDSIKNIFQI